MTVPTQRIISRKSKRKGSQSYDCFKIKQSFADLVKVVSCRLVRGMSQRMHSTSALKFSALKLLECDID